MNILPLASDDARSQEALVRFLFECRDVAAARGRPHLVSISIEADHLDPLAVLESIYEPGELHFYCERQSDRFAVAGAEAVLSFSAEGENRFAHSRRFIEETLENTTAIGDLDLPFSGPHFFTTFAFFDSPKRRNAFPAATVFVPRWQVGMRDGRFCAVANIMVAPDAEVEAIAEKIWRARTKFSAFDYTHAQSDPVPGSARFETTEVGKEAGFCERVESALGLISSNAFDKIVLARAIDAKAPAEFNPLGVLNALRQRFPECYAFSVGNGMGQSFIGASPERLVRIQGGDLLTEALAGSAPRGRSASEDARLASELLKSTKDLREHRLVVESLVRRLQGLGIQATVGSRPLVKQMQNVQHIQTLIRARVPEGIHILDAIAELHPTPAVGGTPRKEACAHIPSLEPFERGLYAGPVGWVDHRGDGESVVAIRSALVDGNTARLYAGAGIVDGSEAGKELAETDLKFRAMLDALSEEN